MKRYFLKNFLFIFSITIVILLVQSTVLILKYSDSKENWKTNVYSDFVKVIANELSDTSTDSSGQSIEKFISSFQDNRVCGIIVTDSNGRLLFSVGNTAHGKPFGKMESDNNVTTCINTIISLKTDGVTTTMEIGDAVKKETVFYGPVNAEIRDIVGSVTVKKNLNVIFTVYLLTYSPITYEYSKDIIKSCLNSLIVSVGISLIIAFAAAWVISKTNTKKINSIRKALNSLALGEENIKTERYKDKEFNQIPIAIEELDKSLQSNRKSQKAWLMSISHDLNTPLSAIKMLVEGIEDGVIKGSDEIFKDLKIQTDILDLRIKKVIDYSSLQSATTIHYSQFLTEQLLAKYQNIDCCIESSKLAGDFKLIQKACDELVSNAVRFGSDSSKPRVSVKETEENFCIEILNDGTLPETINPEDLFKAWTKGDFARNSASNGLGLPIVGTIAKLHEGKAIIKQIDQTKVCATLIWPKK